MKCSVEDCLKATVAGGMCGMHYKRMQRHGSVEQTRPADWGTHENHPLYQVWGWVRKQQRVAREWSSFNTFLQDVGARPSSDYRLYRVDSSKPYGPDNFEWREVKVKVGLVGDARVRANAYARQHRKDFPEEAKSQDLRKAFGIDFAEFSQMKEAQGSVCKICGKAETDIIKGKLVELSVDHCHVSGKVRGLLCGSCNKGLGYFKDDTYLLEQAVQYLLGAS
jgi:Recombination endonuclease VII